MLNRFLPTPCLICRASTREACCDGCLADLPWVPHHCRICGRAVPYHEGCCAACASQPSPYRFRIPLLYQPPVQQIITAFKLREKDYLCAPLASIFVSWLTNSKPDIIIPVPSHRRRLWERGYNPALLIAHHIGKCLGIPVDDRAVRRVRHTPPQRLQSKETRVSQLAGAFEAMCIKPGLRIALFDDVVTTGATLHALATVCAPYATHIEYWAIAESPHLTLESKKPSRETTNDDNK